VWRKISTAPLFDKRFFISFEVLIYNYGEVQFYCNYSVFDNNIHFWNIILDYSSTYNKKALIDQTILDLTYNDCLFYIILLTVSLCIAFISCLMAYENELEFVPAILYSNIIFFLICATSNSLSASSILHILTIIYNSEQQGLQLLGQDDKAVAKIRIFSFSFALLTIILGSLILNIVPPIMGLLIGSQPFSVATIIKNDPIIFCQ
jgi:hypothetical protein